LAIEQLLGDIPTAQFVQNYWCKLPLAIKNGAQAFCKLGRWETVEPILAQPGADVLLARAGEPYVGSRPQSLAEAKELHSSGYTLLVRHAERHDRRLAELASSFYDDFHAPVDIHMYFTPASQSGFGWHYDGEDVFILQTAGVKAYSLRKNTVNPWPTIETLPADMGFDREIMPVMKCTLGPGDWLYIPAGYWHVASADADSISLAVGLQTPTALDVLDLVRQRLLNSLRWRQRLPVTGTACPCPPAELRSQLQSLLSELADDLRQQLSDPDLTEQLLDPGRNHSRQIGDSA
jgi:ribosomal protein L16 Arg81 hydroxylase